MPAVGHVGFWLENQVVCSFRGESGLGRAFHIFGKNQHMRSIILLHSLRGLPEWMGKISHKMRRWDVRHRWIKHSPLSTLWTHVLGMDVSSHPGSCVCWPPTKSRLGSVKGSLTGKKQLETKKLVSQCCHGGWSQPLKRSFFRRYAGPFLSNFGDSTSICLTGLNPTIACWWFQSIWKILVKLGIFPR